LGRAFALRYACVVMHLSETNQWTQTDHVKRTHDYEPFIKEFIGALDNEGLMYALLDMDSDGKKAKKPAAKAKR
jgi:hypothetical protein